MKIDLEIIMPAALDVVKSQKYKSMLQWLSFKLHARAGAGLCRSRMVIARTHFSPDNAAGTES